MGIYGGNPHIPAENVLCLLWVWIKGTMNSLPEGAEVQQMGGGGGGGGHKSFGEEPLPATTFDTPHPQSSIFPSRPQFLSPDPSPKAPNCQGVKGRCEPEVPTIEGSGGGAHVHALVGTH